MLLKTIRVVASSGYVFQTTLIKASSTAKSSLKQDIFKATSTDKCANCSKVCIHCMEITQVDYDIRPQIWIVPDDMVCLDGCINVWSDVCIIYVDFSHKFSGLAKHFKKCSILGYWLLNRSEIGQFGLLAISYLKKWYNPSYKSWIDLIE